VFGLLGADGAGKSTTFKMLTTLLALSSGEARVGGFSIPVQPVEVCRAIGYLPQAVSVDGSLRTIETQRSTQSLNFLPVVWMAGKADKLFSEAQMQF
jgi:ABC-type multidrug transport system ATPase subunit